MPNMCHRKWLVVCLGMWLAAARSVEADGPLLWQRSVSGTDDTRGGLGRSVAADNQGHVVAVGVTSNADTFEDFTVAKFDRNGDLLWQQNLSGNVPGADQAFSVAVGNQGDIVAAGYIQNGVTTWRDFTVARFDRDGQLLWRRSLNGTANGDDEALSVAMDDQGNVVAAGYTQNVGTGFQDFTVAKFDRSGRLLWQRNLDGLDYEIARSVALDNQGNVIAAGFLDTVAGYDFTVAKFDRNGTLLWQRDLDTLYGEAWSLAVDSQGNVVAAGWTIQNVDSSSSAFTVAKFDRNGNILWNQVLHGSANGYANVAWSVTVDNRGRVVAAGDLQNALTNLDFTVAKFGGDGSLLWQQSLSRAGDTSDQALSVAVDNQGNVFASGSTGGFTVVKLDANGLLLWQQRDLNGDGHDTGEAFSVAVDNQGHAVATGFVHDVDANRGSFVVAKFDR